MSEKTLKWKLIKTFVCSLHSHLIFYAKNGISSHIASGNSLVRLCQDVLRAWGDCDENVKSCLINNIVGAGMSQ